MKKVTKITNTVIKEPNKQTEIQETIMLGSPSEDKDFLKIYPLFIEVLQEDLKLKNGRLKLFLWFISQIKDIRPNAEPIVIADQEKMAKALDVDTRTIRRYIQELTKKGYISRYEKKIRSAYLVNPELIYKGSVSKYFSEKADISIKKTKTG